MPSPDAAPLDVARLRQVRALFDTLCELPPADREAPLADPALDPAVAAQARALLQAQDHAGDRVQRHVSRLLVFAQDAELGAGDLLGPWRLLEAIGAGGMGKVFLAERADGHYRRQVAIKLLKGVADPAHAERLQFERQVLAGLQLPNVARLYDGGTTPGGQPYLVMEYVRGLPLDAWCERNDLSISARIALFLLVCDTVRAAHEQLVVHCDLKPANVLVEADGTPVLLDFGVARLLGDAQATAGPRLYTPAYAAPELMDEGHASVRTDVFSLGVILLELLAARPRGRDDVDARRPLPAPSAWTQRDARWRRHLRGDLDAIVARACALEPARRYPTVEALAADIRRSLAHQPVHAREGERGYRARRFVRRNWKALALGTAATVVVAGFIVGLMDARRAAVQEAQSAREISAYLVGMFENTDPRQRGDDAEQPLTARELLDNAARRVATDLQHAPLQRARVQAALGQAYQNLGIAGPAQRLLADAAGAMYRQGGANREETARVHALLALEQAANGDGAAALATAQRGEALHGAQASPQIRAWLAYARGVASINIQDFPAAEAALAQALARLDEVPAGAEADLRARVRYQQALLNWRWGRPAQAERLYRDLLARTPPAQTSAIHDLETRLGQVLRAQGRFAEARRLLEQGMARAGALYGADSRFVLLQHEALADLYWDMGDYRAADAEFQRLLPLAQSLEGARSVRASQALHNYASLRAARGDAAGAERMYREAWDIRREALGKAVTVTLRAEASLAGFLIEQGRIGEARPLHAHAAAGLARQLPADAPALLDATMAQVRLHLREGDVEAARALFGRNRPKAPSAQDALWMLEIDHRIAIAESDAARIDRITREALALATRTLGDGHVETARWRVRRARSLAATDHPGAAGVLAPALPLLRTQLLDTADERHAAEALATTLRRR